MNTLRTPLSALSLILACGTSLATPAISYKGAALGTPHAAFLKAFPQFKCQRIENLGQTLCYANGETYASLGGSTVSTTFLRGKLAAFQIETGDLSEDSAEVVLRTWEGALAAKYGLTRERHHDNNTRRWMRYQSSKWELKDGSISVSLSRLAGQSAYSVRVGAQIQRFELTVVKEADKAEAKSSNDI